MYSSINFKSKKAFKEHVKLYVEQQKLSAAELDEMESKNPGSLVSPVEVFAPGLGSPPYNGKCCVEGPHYPRPHTWYASVTVKDGIVVSVK